MPRFPLPALALALALAAAAAGRAGADEAFIAGVEDLPLMPGLTQIDSAGLVFDTPTGRIVEAYAAGPVAAQAVLDFYAATLPELGWAVERPDRFRREGEELRLEFLDGGDRLTVRFSLSPE
ncbi:MAG: hypothetical protein WEC41_02030 [Dongiaceae bacterium]